MIIEPIHFEDKNGRNILIRGVEVSDAQALIDYMRITGEETKFLLRDPSEKLMSLEQEETFLKARIEAEREAMLVAYDGEKLAGACSLMSMGPSFRYRHRCGVAIALVKAYWRCGIGRAMLTRLLELAKELGYEQAELDAISENDAALSLYESMGFVKYGVFPNNVKYIDDTYADATWMMKKL